MLQKYEDSQEFLTKHSQLVCEETANSLVLWCIELEIEEVRVTVNLPHHGQLTGAVVHRAGDRGGKIYSEPASSRQTHWCCGA